MKCILWNLKWVGPTSKRGRRIAEIMEGHSPDVICLTETTLGMVPEGCSIESQADYGYPNEAGTRRKVALWSRSPWSEIDDLGSSDLPPGRFVTGVTEGIRFVGVCIPWQSAHVASGSRDRKPWQDHLQFLESLKPLLTRYAAEERPVCLLGDFNQRIPPTRQPRHVADALRDMLGDHFRVSTSRCTDAEGGALIDHVAPTKELSVFVKSILSKRDESGLELSDHAGLVLDLALGGKEAFPGYEIRHLMTPTAIRFNGYAFEESQLKKDDTAEDLSNLAKRVVKTQCLLSNDLENFAACFALQRFLCKGGGDRISWESPEWHAYARLFIHLHKKEIPPDFLYPEYDAQWRKLSSEVEKAVVVLRKKLE